MVEQRRFGDLIPHLILLIGVGVVAFPVYVCFVGSTLPQDTIANGQMTLMPGPLFFDTYWRTLFVGTTGTTREPVGTMLVNSFVMAAIIAVGKITIWEAMKSIWPFYGAGLVVLLIVTYIPAVSLWLPSLFH